jgi:uncharacterized protein (DUF885 family)
MTPVRLAVIAGLVLAVAAVPAWRAAATSARHNAAPAPAAPPRTEFERLVDEYFDDTFRRHPARATSAGIHQYDRLLEDYSRASVDSTVASLHRFEARFVAIDPGTLSASAAADREIMINTIRGALLDLEQVRPWERSPDRYMGAATRSLYVLMSRKFASAEVRLRDVIERERLIPNVFADARDNLKNPPRIYTEIAIQQIPGTIAFFRTNVPMAFQSVQDRKLKTEFAASNAAVIAALEKYQTFLETNLLPRSKGDFRIGAENYRKKLLYDEMVDIPLDRLLKIGYDDLRANQQRFKEVAAKIDPTLKPSEVLARINADHPAPDKLLQRFRDLLGGIRQFLIDRHIVTVPSRVMPIVQETPPFSRALSFASMDTPGAYETVATEAYFNVTLPEKDWPQEKIEGHMAKFSEAAIAGVAIHEVFPGHYIQFLWVPRAPSKVRKLTGCGSNAEGWAHYCEQMMLDEGFGNGDPVLRLGQVEDALLRDARYIAGIQMHTGKWTREQAEDFFVKEGYQTRAVAERESKRGTADPTYLVYTLGKLQILKLRDDYKKLRGDKFSLQEFHDEFLSQGFPPIKIVRKAMLGEAGPTL